MSSSKDVTFKLKCELDDGATKSIDTLEERLEKLNKLTKIKLEFDTSDAESSLSKIEKRLEELHAKAKIKVQMDDDGVSSSRKSAKSGTKRQTGRMRTPSRPRNTPDTRTEADHANTVRPARTVRPATTAKRDRAGAARATSAKNNKPSLSRKRGLVKKPLRGRAGLAMGIASLGMGFLAMPENMGGGSGPESKGGSSDEYDQYDDMPMTEQYRDRDRTAMILSAAGTGAQNLLSNGMHEKDARNLNTTIETATTLGMAGAAYTAGTGTTLLGAGLGTVGAGGVIAGGGGFLVGNYVGRKISGQDEAEAQLAENLEQEQRLIDKSPAIAKKYSRLHEASLSKQEKERRDYFKNASKSDVDEFKTDMKGLSGSQEERLEAIDSLRSKNESQREAAAKEASLIADRLERSKKAIKGTEFNLQGESIAKDLDAQTSIVSQQDEQLNALAEARLRIEKEITKEKEKADAIAQKAEAKELKEVEKLQTALSKAQEAKEKFENKDDPKSKEDRAREHADKLADSVEKAMEALTSHFERRMSQMQQDNTNVRNGG